MGRGDTDTGLEGGAIASIIGVAHQLEIMVIHKLLDLLGSIV
jgi:hypothetical protein